VTPEAERAVAEQGAADQVAVGIDQAVDGRTLIDAMAEAASGHGGVSALKWRSGSQWQSLSWRELRDQVEYAALGLAEFGVRAGEPVGILGSSRPELVIADYALLLLRAVPVFLFPSFTDEQMATVLRTLGITTVIVEGQAELARLRAAARQVIVTRQVIMTGTARGPASSWERLIAAGRARASAGDGGFAAYRRAVRPDDLVSVNYTSGTTGTLKGIRHTHRNVLWHAESFARFMPMPPGTRFLSYGPRAHATERFVSAWLPLTRAATVHLCPDPALLGEYLPDVRPQFFGGVHRVWEKMYAAASALMTAERVPAAMISSRLGLDACRFAFSGGGSLAAHVQEFFNSAGVPLAEGWGQSELVSAATCGRPGGIRIGTAGRSLPGVTVRAAADGELLVRSGSRMLGYVGQVRQPSPVGETSRTGQGKAAGREDWLHTGDLGRIDADGYVHVHGRREEVFRLADGYLVPVTRVESQLRANLLVDHAYVVGEGMTELCAILIVGTPAGQWTAADLAAIVREGNRRLPPSERIARFEMLACRWEPGRAEELTHTGKLNRPRIAAKYADLIASLLGGTGIAMF
jgi:long-chain acyl-CoA synthetase